MLINKDCVHCLGHLELVGNFFCFHPSLYPEPEQISDDNIKCEGCDLYEKELVKSTSIELLDIIVKDILQGFSRFSNDIVFPHPKEKHKDKFVIENITQNEQNYLDFLYMLNLDIPHLWGQIVNETPFWNEKKRLYFNEIEGWGAVGGYSTGEMAIYGNIMNSNLNPENLTYLQFLLLAWTKNYLERNQNYYSVEYYICPRCGKENEVTKWSKIQFCNYCDYIGANGIKKDEWMPTITINKRHRRKMAEIPKKNWNNPLIQSFLSDFINSIREEKGEK
jgi:ribosomal protein L37AE/L43A